MDVIRLGFRVVHSEIALLFPFYEASTFETTPVDAPVDSFYRASQ